MTEVDSDDDLTKELQPLAYHVCDRKRVLSEAFRALKGKRLEAMIPPGLKSWSRAKLESNCLSILEDLSDETLLAILDGRIGTAGVAAVEQTESPDPAPAKVKNDDEPTKKKKRKAKVTAEEQEKLRAAKLKKKKKLAKAKLKEKLKKKKKAAAEAEAPPAPAPHKSLMELLELEYRAKAIKALLRSQGQSVPDIPLNIDDDEESQKESVTQEKNKSQAGPLVNGSPDPVPGNSGSSTIPPKSSTKSKVPKVPKPTSTNAVAPPPSAKEQPKPTPKPEVKPKEVGKLIDEALNTSIGPVPEGSLPTSNSIKPPLAIVQACETNPAGTEEDLRSKLLRKYQQQQAQQVVVVKPESKKKKRKKQMPEQNDDPEEDILDLHPQELSLSDEGHAAAQASENESSEYETESENENDIEKDKALPLASSGTGNNGDDENMDEGESETEAADKDSAVDNKSRDEEDSERTLSEEVQDATGKTDETNDDEIPDVIAQSMEEAVISDQKNAREEIIKNQASPKMPSKSSRHDIFETAPEEKSKPTTFTSSGQTQSQKRRITFRIDPARIGALEEQAAEEEAKRAEERKLEEEELKRLAEMDVVEVEEGEIDSNEEELESYDQEKASPRRSPSVERRKQYSSPERSEHDKHDTESDSDDSEGSTSYYTRRKPYKRTASTKSPPKECSEKNLASKNPPMKRSASPVEFITQFSDMEPVSEDDDDSSETKKHKTVADTIKDSPVQGCASKPENKENAEFSGTSVANEDSKNSEEKDEGNEEEEDEGDEMPKPVTWYERWAESHGMQKVVKTNQIHKKVRSKLKQVTSSKKEKPAPPKHPEPSVEAEPIIGSIEEYEKLFGKKVTVDPDDDGQGNNSPAGGEDENDDYADDLWGDIIGDS